MSTYQNRMWLALLRWQFTLLREAEVEERKWLYSCSLQLSAQYTAHTHTHTDHKRRHTYWMNEQMNQWMDEERRLTFSSSLYVKWSWSVNNKRSSGNDPTPSPKPTYNFCLILNLIIIGSSHPGVQPAAQWEREKSKVLRMKGSTQHSSNSIYTLSHSLNFHSHALLPQFPWYVFNTNISGNCGKFG